ncbi:tRNA modification GTPase MnmE [Bacteroidetes bacterium UKL13-3]|jgi:tRNA modification GTPase|nr:tRNA modification GTPase MnmE [Bacteroidetes bacterium UKL13-3]HCP93593.1 tRNA uridine-5-carboxymethylaminomethyl(34) synthesis GTPase MnmE [Bacteroidota bacterium]
MNHYLKTDLDDTICALATAGGIGAIGVIRISGSNTLPLVNSLFKGKNLEQADSHTLHFGKIIQDDIILDEVLASVFKNPKSYTGEDTIELSCHGSPYILQKILELLVQKGARLAKPGEFTLRAFLNKKLDLSQAEAVADLIAADSAASHQTAMQQMRGGYSQQIQNLREKLINFASLIELELDFAEEDVEFASKSELFQLVQNIHSLLQSLLQSFQYGNVLKNGVPTVIAGRPNAGKSTLLNALLKEERAIVSNIAGTTRDTIEESFVVDGVTFRLIDTAGIRHSNDTIESIGIERTFEAMQKASLILYIFDASQTTPEELQVELSQIPAGNHLIIPIGNKVDLLTKSVNQLTQLPANSPEITYLSSLNKHGIDELIERLKNFIRTNKRGNDIVVSNLRHFEALQQASNALEQVLQAINLQMSGELLSLDIRKAIFHLGEITGEITTEDLLGNIFSKFCIGK